MPTYLPYLLLVLFSLIIDVSILVRERRRIVLVLPLAYSGMIYLFEIMVVVILQGYEYRPGIVRDGYLDSMLGATVSNLLMVPSLALLISYYQLQVIWIVFFALLLGGMDVLFVHLGIYRHHWWSSVYTVISLLAFFGLCRIWIRKVRPGKPVFLYVTYLVYAFCIATSTVFVLLLSGWRRFRLGLLEPVVRDDVLLSVITAFGLAFILVNATYWTNNRRFLFLGWMLLALGQYLLYRSGHLILHIAPWIYAAAYAATLLLVTYLCIGGLKALRAFGS